MTTAPESLRRALSEEIWAKSPPLDGGPGQTGYPLLPHLLDVSAVASVLLPVVPCPVLLPCSEAWIVSLVGLHDFGKASPGFQRKLGRTHVGTYQLVTDLPDRHDLNIVILLTDLLKARGLQHRAALALVNAVGAHHGHPFADHEIGKADVVRVVRQHSHGPHSHAHASRYPQRSRAAMPDSHHLSAAA